ncbi:L-rhamnose 1-dehydrogenase [Tothia fuscella]|uniref:L-rhamnose 1-dehydrogenase n=1 Tax=Tothia fuscella TaxID=1048955 RepID=A0A9P4NQH3_9PEZI|nr:L-rhamnose 1-dehydrogenase [Tothia fuscella]
MSGLLAGKSAAITGAATGIGRAIVLEYLRQGASVAVNHLGDESSVKQFHSLTEEAQAGAKLIVVVGDISKQETADNLVNETVKAFGKLDIFVSNAGVCKFADFLTLEKDLFDFTVSTNLSGAFYATQAAARQMVAQGHGGAIIGMSSISALVGGAYQTHYTPTKAAVTSLMQSCACALGKYQIRCNALLPGTIRTQLNEDDLSNDEKRRYMESRIPLGRTGVPQDMAGPAVFLASDMAQYVTGAQLLVDGGLFVNLQ